MACAFAEAAFLETYAETRGFSLGQPQHLRVVDAGRKVLYLRGEARSNALSLYCHDIASGRSELLLQAHELLGGDEVLGDAEKARRERLRQSMRGFVSFGLSQDHDLLVLPIGGRVFFYCRSTGKHWSLAAEGVIDPQLSRDGKTLAFVRAHNLYVADVDSGAISAISKGGHQACSFGSAEFVAQEEMGRMYGFALSFDGRSICYQETDTRDVEVLCISDPLRPENEPLRLPYPRPGKKNAAVRLWQTPIADPSARTEIMWDKSTFEYLAAFNWPAAGGVAFVVQDRAQRHQQLLQWQDGKAKLLVEEHDAAWINLYRSMPAFVPQGFLWISEADGQPTLSLHDANGQHLRTLCKAVVELVHKDATHAYVLQASVPTRTQLVKVPLSGEPAQVLDLEEGEHVLHIGAGHVADIVAGKELFRSARIHDLSSDREVAEIPSVAELTTLVPNATWTQVHTSGHSFEAVILRPHKSQAGKLPVLLSIYGGPHHLHVRGCREPYFCEQWLAEQGYIVVAIDNRGTPRRGRAWERVISGDFSQVPLADQTSVLQALMAQHPEMDSSRVGVFGWSFGGYMAALCAMKRPEVFKSAVAGAPVVDWYDYDTHYTERYLGLPADNPAAYTQSSLLTHAPALQRPLLLIHGTADDNVYFFHTLKLSDALSRQGIAHHLLPLAGATHMVAEPALVKRLWEAIARHFQQTLLPGD